MQQLTEKSQAFIKMLIKRGILRNLSMSNEKICQQKDQERYHNTLLLLQNYRTLVWVMECFPETVAEELDQPFADINELLNSLICSLLI